MFTLMDYWKSSPGSDLLLESGRRIRDRRNKLKISQTALLEYVRRHTGIKSRTVISEWEHGKRRIESLGQLAALAERLQCDPEYITCQCGTERKKYADPVSRFGLSENAFAVLEQAPGKNGFGPVVDFVLCNENVRQAFKSMLKLHDRIKSVNESLSPEEQKAAKEYEKGEGAEERLTAFNDPEGKLIIAKYPKTDFFEDSFGQYIVDPEQAVYIAEQQLIDRIREALKE